MFTSDGFRLSLRNVNGRPLFVRASYLIVLALLSSYCVYHVVRFASITTDENTYIDSAKGVLITEVERGGASDRAGLKPGDVIVEINGKRVHTSGEAMVYLRSGSEGKKLAYTINRESALMTVSVSLAVFGINLFTLSLILTGVLLFVFSAFVILRRPSYPVARLFGWAMLMSGMFTFTSFNYSEYYYLTFIDRLNAPLMLISYALGFGAMYHLFFRFPVDRFTTPVPQWIHTIVYGMPMLFGLVAALKLLPQRPYTLPVMTGLVIAIVETTIRYKLKLRKNPELGPKATFTRSAGVLVLVFAALAPFLRPNAAWQGVFLLQTLVPILLFATIVRHRIFDLYVVVRRTSMYRALLLSLNLASIGVFAWSVVFLSAAEWRIPVPSLTGTAFQFVELSTFPAVERAAIESRLIVAASLLIAWLCWKVRLKTRTLLDAKFYRGDYDYRRALTAFSKLSVRFADPVALAQAVVADLTSIMHLSGAAFVRRTPARFGVDAALNIAIENGRDDILNLDSDWLASLEQKGSAEAIENLSAGRLFAGTGVEFAAPVSVDARLEAVILLGEKLSGTNFSKDDVELLANLSINVADAIVTMNFYEGTKEQERMRRELEIARRIQLSALPGDLPEFPGLDVSAISEPAYEVGGDFYDFLGHHNAITFLVGDVSGKGTSAALYLSRAQGIVRAIDSYGPSLWELLVRLNTQIFDHIDRQSFLTLSALRVHLLSEEITFLRAGHLPLLQFRRSAGEVIEHKPRGIGIGLDATSFGTHLEELTLHREAGDVFLLVTDGITEAADAAGHQYGMDRVADVLRTHAGSSAREIRDALFASVRQFSMGCEQFDDMTVLVVSVL